MSKKTLHIDISERKLLLRSLDIVVMVISISVASVYYDFNYLDISKGLSYLWFIVLALYFLLFGEVFQLYNLKISNNRFLVFRSIIITSSVTTFIYVFSPYFTPSLPENRLQILYFFLLITLPVTLWRFTYIWVFFSPKYFKTIIVIGHSSRAEKLIELIQLKNFHNIATYVSNEEIDGLSNYYNVKTVDLLELVHSNLATEIVLSTSGFSSETIKKLNKQLNSLFEEGINIKSFEKYYEEVTDRVPKEYLDHNFYKQINLSKNNDNRFYHFSQRVFDIIISILGLTFFVCILPIILLGNLIASR